MRRLLLIASLIFSAFYLLLIASPDLVPARVQTNYFSNLSALLKVTPILLLIAYAALSHPRSKALVVALIFSAIGDALLALTHFGPILEGDLFLFGLGAFLLAHAWYIALFSRNLEHAISPSRKLGIVLVILVLALALYVLWPQLGSMRLAVLIYALALDTMAITAQASRFPDIVAGGALLFVASDAMLAMDHFGHSFSNAGVLVWTTYYLAQLMITTGVVAQTASSKQKASPTGEADH